MEPIYHRLMSGALLLFWLYALPSFSAPLTLAHACELAEQNSPVLSIIRSQADGAQSALETAGAYPNPEVEFGAGNSQLLSPTAQSGHNSLMAISQPIELPALRHSRQRGAEAGVVAGSALLDDARINLHSQVKQAFLELLRRQDEALLAAENYELLLQISNRIKQRVEVGEAPRYELVKSEAESLTAQSVAKGAEIKVMQAKDRLRTLLGVPTLDQFEIVRPPPMAEKLPVIGALRAELLEKQPLLKFYAAESARAAAKLDQEHSLRTPQPTLKWSAERHPDVNLWRVGISIPLPLWDRRSGPIGEARTNLDRARADHERVRLNLLGELDQAYGRYQIAQRQLDIFETGLLRDAESAVKVAEAAYRYGERGILDYLDAQRVFRSTRMDYLNARYELQFALIDIERLRAADGETK